jgi:hypothetical protein
MMPPLGFSHSTYGDFCFFCSLFFYFALENPRFCLMRSDTGFPFRIARAGLWKRSRARIAESKYKNSVSMRCCLLIWVLGIKFCRSIGNKISANIGVYQEITSSSFYLRSLTTLLFCLKSIHLFLECLRWIFRVFRLLRL